MAGSAIGVRPVADGLEASPQVLHRRDLGQGPHCATGPGRRSRWHRLEGLGRLDQLACSPARRHCCEVAGRTQLSHRGHGRITRPGRRCEEPADHAIGRSRGGLTTKTHALVDGNGLPLVIALTPGQANDSPALPKLLAELRVPRVGPDLAARGSRRSRCARTRPTPRAGTAPTSELGASPLSSPHPPTRSAIARTRAREAGDPSTSMPATTRTATSWSGPSTT